MALVVCKECSASISTAAKKCPICGAPQYKISFVKVIIAVIALFLFYKYVILDQEGVGEKSTSADPYSKENISRDIHLYSEESIDKYGYMTADFTITNNSLTSVTDIKIKCINKSKTYSYLDSNTRVLYEFFQAGTTKSVKNFDMGLVHSQRAFSMCNIVSFQMKGG